MSDFPTHWVLSSFGEVSEYIQRGKGPKYCERSEFPVVNQKAIRWYGIEEQHLKFVAEEQWPAWGEERFIRERDILWNSTGTGTVGRACHLDETQAKKAKVVDSHVTIVRLSNNIDSKFGYYWIRSPEIQAKIDSLSSGSTNQVELSRSIVLETLFPLPPLAEQTRIAAKIDELLAQVDTLKSRIDGIPALLKRFRQSVLAAAVSGSLTEDWREQNSCSYELPEILRLSEIASAIVDCPHSTPKWQSYGKKCVRTTEFRPGFLDVNAAGFVSEETYVERTRRIKPEGGDILYAREGTVGIACPVPHDVDLCMGQRMVLIRAGARIHPTYLLHALNSELVLSKVRSLVMGSTAPRINVKDLKNFEIPTPSLNEQTEIVRRVEQLFAFADQLEAKVKDAKTRIDRLTQSILAKAFRGELVPQDPSDEPASELLARIQAQRAATSKPRQRRKA